MTTVQNWKEYFVSGREQNAKFNAVAMDGGKFNITRKSFVTNVNKLLDQKVRNDALILYSKKKITMVF